MPGQITAKIKTNDWEFHGKTEERVGLGWALIPSTFVTQPIRVSH